MSIADNSLAWDFKATIGSLPDDQPSTGCLRPGHAPSGETMMPGLLSTAAAGHGDASGIIAILIGLYHCMPPLPLAEGDDDSPSLSPRYSPVDLLLL